jgi:uncharacterized protein (UPF0332 family)
VSLHGDLIAQARHLSQKEPRRPKQASLRRAISTAYYGLFHCLLASAAASFLSQKHRALRPALMRVFKHREMAEACQRLLKLKAQPAAMAPFVGGAALPLDLEIVAEAFVALQQARHEADYDLARRFARSEAQDLVDLADAAVQALDRVSGDPHCALLFVAFLDPKQIRLQ